MRALYRGLGAGGWGLGAGVGRTLGEGGPGGGSDGNLTAALGVPTLDGLGAVGGGAHAEDEHVTIADLPWRGALLAGLLREVSRSTLVRRR